ncbi:hypothetical protein B0T14DRAFT_494010 [Immersiella caudata]|uniref:Uncharacterized protein n=1 Tax=Immersiella caudata TaxID=314043 RepID=A0AA40C290_9PEZI|nr:hypothetical protein B0T14DRAFT_494010 [Immersiella caudata]
MAPTTRSRNTLYNLKLAADLAHANNPFPFTRQCVRCKKDRALHNFNTWCCKHQASGPEVCEICASFFPDAEVEAMVDALHRREEREQEMERERKRMAEDDEDEEKPAARRVKIKGEDAVARSRGSLSDSGLSVTPFPSTMQASFKDEVKVEVMFEDNVKVKREDAPSPVPYFKIESQIKTESDIKYEPEIKPDPDAEEGDQELRDRALFWLSLKNCIRAAEDRVGMELAGVMIDDYAEEDGLNFLFLNLD